MKRFTKIIIPCLLAGAVVAAPLIANFSAVASRADAAVYKENPYMAELSLPTEDDYEEKDWKQTTIDFLTYVLDESNVYEGESGTRKIARYTSSTNAKAYFESIGMSEEAPTEIWSIPPYVAKGDNVTLGEGITVIAAVMSGALAGMDMTAYTCTDGVTRNFVKGVVEYYQAANGENVVLNGGAGGRTGNTWWYELLPGVLFSVLGTQYESESYYMYDIITESARQWRSVVEGLGGASADFYHTSYSLLTGEPFDGNWYEPDAAAGMAYILYSAYSLNLNLKNAGEATYATDAETEEFREAAVWCMNYLEKLDSSPFYEVLTFLAPYLAARMNVEQGTNYNVAKMFGWVLDGSSTVRSGWGMVTENWGDKYTNGLMGSLTDGDGYAFAMNTFDAMLGFAPMVKYDTRFAKDVSRWVLCVSQSARNYYPSEYEVAGAVEDAGSGNTVYHGIYQSGNWLATDSAEAKIIAYEGLRRYRRYVIWDNGTRTTAWDRSVTPYASGDAFTFDWGGETDYGLYGSAHVGLFGGTIEYTDVPMILRTDLNKLDVFSSGSIPFWMYYNPYETAKTITVTLTEAGNRLYDTVSKTYLETTAVDNTTVKVTLPADTTVVLAEIPSGASVTQDGSDYTCNGEFVAQDRGSVDLTLYSDQSGETEISSGSSVEGTVYASLTASIPDTATAESLTLTYGSVTLYSGTTPPSGLIEIDTASLKNGKGTLTATLTLTGGKVEKSTISLQILNVVKTPAVEYEDIDDMVTKWSAATAEWASLYPNSDHTSSVSAGSDGSLVITVESPKGYGFATSELFTVDFSRGPMLEFEVSDVSAQYAVKLYVEGMTNNNNYTGVYLIRDTSGTGTVSLDILEAIQQEDRTFSMTGAHKVSIKISPVGTTGDYVAIKDLNLYHMYTSPVLDEPDQYEWEHDFTSEWLSLWSGAESDGGVNGGVLEYTNDGTVRVTASDSSNEYSGVASPYILTDLGQNPVFDLTLQKVTGKYFVGVKFEGSETLYILAENKTDLSLSVEILSALRANYPDETFKGTVNLKIIIGVMYDGEAEFSEVNTYYKLTSWGDTVKNDLWLDWEKCSDTTAVGSLALDTSNRAVITNNGSSSNETATAGMRGKFTLNFDYNPELTIIVRGHTGQWRLTLTTFTDGTKYILTSWSDQNATVTVNLNEMTGGALSGKQNVYIAIEVLGGGHTVTVTQIKTFYTAINPDFETGETLTSEIATWNKDSTNPSDVSVSDGEVTVSESYPDSKGLYTDSLLAETDSNPYIVVTVSALGEGSAWYLNAVIGGTVYALTGSSGSTALGTTAIDVVAALKEAGYETAGSFEAVYELGGTGDAFSVTFASVCFIYRLSAPEVSLDESTNTISFASDGAESYNVRIENSEGAVVWSSDNTSAASVALDNLSLATGVYRIYVSACGGNVLESAETRLAFKQGDIPSITLAAPSNIQNSGMKLVWDEVDDAEYYSVVLSDANTDGVIASQDVTEASFDLSSLGLTAFNYKISVTAKGDGVVYLDSATTEYAFYTNVIENYNAKKFESMSANDNQASASYDEESDTATLTVPYTNWGSIVSLETKLNFDNSPVLVVEFAAGCVGGYYFKIFIDGTAYYLTDNTFTVHGNEESVYVYLDICDILASRSDGPSDTVSGTHTVRILFGATADGFDGADSPVIKIASARLIEMTAGAGVEKYGTLAAPEVTVSGMVASWDAVEHAQQYIFVLSNESGVLLSVTISETSYDCSFLQRAGEYTVQVTAIADDYYSSDTGSAVFTLEEDAGSSSSGSKKGCGSAASGLSVFAALAAIAALAVVRRGKSGKKGE